MSTAKPSALRVVLDTNVYFSAFTHPQGVPFRLWQEAVRGHYTLLISPAIMREIGRVLRQRLNWREAEVVAHLKLLAKTAEIISPEITIRAVVDDEDDNRILECAVAGHADLVVSGDHHTYGG